MQPHEALACSYVLFHHRLTEQVVQNKTHILRNAIHRDKHGMARGVGIELKRKREAAFADRDYGEGGLLEALRKGSRVERMRFHCGLTDSPG